MRTTKVVSSVVGEPIERGCCSRVQVLARGEWIPLLALQAYRPWATKVKKKEKKKQFVSDLIMIDSC